MTDELKRKFEHLVADAPPPSGVPSEGVLDRVRTVKRRRTATAGILATAVVVAGVIAAGNLTKLNSAPAPLTNTPGPTTVVTAPPTTTPSPPPPNRPSAARPRPSRRPRTPTTPTATRPTRTVRRPRTRPA